MALYEYLIQLIECDSMTNAFFSIFLTLNMFYANRCYYELFSKNMYCRDTCFDAHLSCDAMCTLQ